MRFDYNPRVLEQLGKELITSDEVAFTELLKNSFDARAKNARVHFFDSIDIVDHSNLLSPLPDGISKKIKEVHSGSKIIIVEDDGKGMTLEELEKGFFTVGTDIKEREKEYQFANAIRDKIILGDKGLGRLAAQRLSEILIVETSSKDDETVHFTVIEWGRFFVNKNEDAPVDELKKGITDSYTRLWFLGNVNLEHFIQPKDVQLKFSFDTEKIKAADYDLKEKLFASINFLYSPFENLEQDFGIAFYINNEKIDSAFQNESIKIAQSVHEFEVKKDKSNYTLNVGLEIKPWYLELIHFRVIGNKPIFEKYRKSHDYYAKLLVKYRDRYSQSLSKSFDVRKYLQDKNLGNSFQLLEGLFPMSGKVYSFYRDAYRYNLILNAAKETGVIEKRENVSPIKQFLDLHNGIKLYRDKYRIANLGDKDNDWLNLQQERTKGQQFFRFELGNVIGYVTINDIFQQNIKETTSRQGLKESPVSGILIEFLKNVINTEFYHLSTAAYYLTRDILFEEKLIPENNPDNLKKRVDESERLLKETQKNLQVFQRSMVAIRENMDLNTPEKIEKVRKIILDIDDGNQLLTDNLNYSINTLDTAKEAIVLIQERQKEAYNNYKLMANGLITEVITHELHSILLNTKSSKNHNDYVEAIKNYLIEEKQPKLYKDNLLPLGERLNFLHGRMTDLDHFYNFLEKTFIKQGTHEDFERQNLGLLVDDFAKRFDKRLKEIKTTISFDQLHNTEWYVPKGTLIHVLYNLIDNSIHWIGERQRRAGYDDLYKTSSSKDSISIEKLDENSIIYYDSGTGISPQYQYSLFHPFVTGKKEGRGMGLYIVKHLLESFNGNIELLPDENKFGNRYKFLITVKSYEPK